MNNDFKRVLICSTAPQSEQDTGHLLSLISTYLHRPPFLSVGMQSPGYDSDMTELCV